MAENVDPNLMTSIMTMTTAQATLPSLVSPTVSYSSPPVVPANVEGLDIEDSDTEGSIVLKRLTLTPFEAPFYVQLWGYSNPQNLKELPGKQAAQFLRKSGLSKSVLRQIWAVVDVLNRGRLSFGDFCAACRLVAHAQNQAPISINAIKTIPQTIPYFNITHSVDSILSPASNFPPTAAAAPLVAADSDCLPSLGSTWMNPDAAGAALLSPFTSNQEEGEEEMDVVQQKLLIQRCAAGLCFSTDQNQYLKLLKSLPLDTAGYLDEKNAKKFLGQFGLSASDISEIWKLSDRDVDGRLSPKESIVAMHLVSLYCKGRRPLSQSMSQSLPLSLSPSAELPPQPPSTVASPFPGSNIDEGRPDSIEEKVLDTDTLKKGSNEGEEQKCETEVENPPLSTSNSQEKTLEQPAPIIEEVDESETQILESFAKLKRSFEEKQQNNLEVELNETRAKLNEIQQEREKVEREKSATIRELERYDQQTTKLKAELENMEKNEAQEMQLAVDETIPTNNEKKEKRRRRKLVATPTEAQEKVKIQLDELKEMHARLEQQRQEKDAMQKKHTELREQLKQAEQDRGLLVYTRDAQTSKLIEIQKQRSEVTEEIKQLTELIVETKADLFHFNQAFPSQASPSHPTFMPDQSIMNVAQPQRDPKGIPTGFFSSPGLAPKALDFRDQFSSIPTTWTSVSLSNFFFSVPLPARLQDPTIDADNDDDNNASEMFRVSQHKRTRQFC